MSVIIMVHTTLSKYDDAIGHSAHITFKIVKKELINTYLSILVLQWMISFQLTKIIDRSCAETIPDASRGLWKT